MLLFNFISVYCFITLVATHTIPKSTDRATPEGRFETLNLEEGDRFSKQQRPRDPDFVRVEAATDSDADATTGVTTAPDRHDTSKFWSHLYKHFKTPAPKTKRGVADATEESLNFSLPLDLLNATNTEVESSPGNANFSKRDDDFMLIITDAPSLVAGTGETPRNYTTPKQPVFMGVNDDSMSVTAAIEQYLNDLTKKAGQLMWNKPLEDLIRTTVMETLYEFNTADRVEETTHSLVDRDTDDKKCKDPMHDAAAMKKAAKSKLMAIYAKVLDLKQKWRKKTTAKKGCKPCSSSTTELPGSTRDNPKISNTPEKARVQRFVKITSKNHALTPRKDNDESIDSYEKALSAATEQAPSGEASPANAATEKRHTVHANRDTDDVTSAGNRHGCNDHLINLAKKIAYKDYVNGYKYYLDFLKEQRGDRQFSNNIKFQAHKRHKVDDIGKFILTKIPRVTTTRFAKRMANSEEKPNESWMKKYFNIFTDDDSTQKYHTTETVLLKAGHNSAIFSSIDQKTDKNADVSETLPTAVAQHNVVKSKKDWLSKVKKIKLRNPPAIRRNRSYSAAGNRPRSRKDVSDSNKSTNVKMMTIPDWNADLLDHTEASVSLVDKVKTKEQGLENYKKFIFRQSPNRKRDIGVIEKLKHFFKPSDRGALRDRVHAEHLAAKPTQAHAVVSHNDPDMAEGMKTEPNNKMLVGQQSQQRPRSLNEDYDSDSDHTIKYKPLARTSPNIFLGMVRDANENSASDLDDLIDASHRMINRANQIAFNNKIQKSNNDDVNIAPKRVGMSRDTTDEIFFVRTLPTLVESRNKYHIRSTTERMTSLDSKYQHNYNEVSTTKSKKLRKEKTTKKTYDDNMKVLQKNIVSKTTSKPKDLLIPLKDNKDDHLTDTTIDSNLEDVGELSESWHDFLQAYDELSFAIRTQNPTPTGMFNVSDVEFDENLSDSNIKYYKPRVYEMKGSKHDPEKSTKFENVLGRIEQDFHDNIKKIKAKNMITTPKTKARTTLKERDSTNSADDPQKYTLGVIEHEIQMNEDNLKAKKMKYAGLNADFRKESDADDKARLDKFYGHHPTPYTRPNLRMRTHPDAASRALAHHTTSPWHPKAQVANTRHPKMRNHTGEAGYNEDAKIFSKTSAIAAHHRAPHLGNLHNEKSKLFSTSDPDVVTHPFWNNFYPSTIKQKIMHRIHSNKGKSKHPNRHGEVKMKETFPTHSIDSIDHEDDLQGTMQRGLDGKLKWLSKDPFDSVEWTPNFWNVATRASDMNSPLKCFDDLKVEEEEEKKKNYGKPNKSGDAETPKTTNRKGPRKEDVLIGDSKNTKSYNTNDRNTERPDGNALGDRSIVRKTAIAIHSESYERPENQTKMSSLNTLSVSVFPKLSQMHNPFPAQMKYQTKIKTSPKPQQSYSAQILMNATDFEKFLKSNGLDIMSVTSPEVVNEEALSTASTAVPSRLLDYRTVDVINVGGRRSDRVAYGSEHAPSHRFGQHSKATTDTPNENVTSSPMSSIYDNLPVDTDSLGSYDFAMKMITPSGIIDISFPFKFDENVDDDEALKKDKTKKAKKPKHRKKAKTVNFLDMKLMNSPTHNELIFERDGDARRRRAKSPNGNRFNRDVATEKVETKVDKQQSRPVREVDRECTSKKAPKHRSSRRPSLRFLPLRPQKHKQNKHAKGKAVSKRQLPPLGVTEAYDAKRCGDDGQKCQHDFLSKMLSRGNSSGIGWNGGKLTFGGDGGGNKCGCQGQRTPPTSGGGCRCGGSGDGGGGGESKSWEWLQSYLGHNRVCSCKCKEDEPMCRPCAASHLVMSELIFELDNMIRYMTDHCTEIQTYFWMNPSGGRKLRSRVHKIDQTIDDYFKRVKGKCQGRTCDSFRHCVERRKRAVGIEKRRDGRPYGAMRSQLKRRKYILRKRYNFYRKAVAAKTAILNEVMFECLNIPLYNEVNKNNIFNKNEMDEESQEMLGPLKKRIHHKMFPDPPRAITIANVTEADNRKKRDTSEVNIFSDEYQTRMNMTHVNDTDNTDVDVKGRKGSLINFSIKNINDNKKKREILKDSEPKEDLTVILTIKDGNREYILQGDHKKSDKNSNSLDIGVIANQLNDLLALLISVANITDNHITLTEMEYIPESKTFSKKILDVIKRLTVLYHKDEPRTGKQKTTNPTSKYTNIGTSDAPTPRYETVKKRNDETCIVRDLNKITIFSIGLTTQKPERMVRPFSRKSSKCKNEVFLLMKPRHRSTTPLAPTAVTSAQTEKAKKYVNKTPHPVLYLVTPPYQAKNTKLHDRINSTIFARKMNQVYSNKPLADAERKKGLLLAILAFDAKKLEADWKKFGGETTTAFNSLPAVSDKRTSTTAEPGSAYEDDDELYDFTTKSDIFEIANFNSSKVSDESLTWKDDLKSTVKMQTDENMQTDSSMSDAIKLINDQMTPEPSFWKAIATVLKTKEDKVKPVDKFDYVYLDDVITHKNLTMDSNSSNTEVDTGMHNEAEDMYLTQSGTTSVVLTWYTDDLV